jgi:hypothetical protein
LSGIPYFTAVVSSSRNCAAVVERAGLADFFDARVDGVVLDEEGLPGKPHPAMFLEAARRLGVPPARAAVVEDAVAGVEAGARGGFALVVGVDRGDQAEALRERGAHVVVRDLGELADEVADAGGGLCQLGDDQLGPFVLAQDAVELGRVDPPSPLGLPVHGARAVGIAELGPALPELAARGHERRLAGADQIGDRGLHRAAAAGGEEEHLVLGLEDRLQPLQHTGIHLDERRRAVVEHRLCHHLRDRRRQRRRPGGHQVLL